MLPAFYKQADYAFQVEICFSANAPQGGSSKNVFQNISGNLQQSFTGIASCYTFREHLGEQVANIVAGQVNQVIRQN